MRRDSGMTATGCTVIRLSFLSIFLEALTFTLGLYITKFEIDVSWYGPYKKASEALIRLGDFSRKLEISYSIDTS